MESQRSTVLLQNFLADPKNRELFGKFATKYQPRIKRCCERHRLQDADADELTAIILLQFCKGDVFDDFVFRTKEQVYAWLNQFIWHAALTYLRASNRRPGTWSVGNTDAQQSIEQVAAALTGAMEAEYAETLARIEEELSRVKSRVDGNTFEAFRLSVFDELKTEEVAQRLSMPKNSVYKAVSRIRQMLREELKDLHG